MIVERTLHRTIQKPAAMSFALPKAYGMGRWAVVAFLLAMYVGEGTGRAATPTGAAPEAAGISSDAGRSAAAAAKLLQTTDFVYLGAFRLPGGTTRPKTFAYGGNAMTFNPAGDASGPNDGYPGSLFITGHDRLPYGELPNGGQVAEVSIPVPVVSKKPKSLPRSTFVQQFQEVAKGYFAGMDEIPRIGMQYVDTAATGPKIHLAWGQHFELDPPIGTHAWFDTNLKAPDVQGTWFIGNESFYGVNDYMLEIPKSWADKNAKGRYLGTGRYRDGGWSGMGPTLFAYRPWTDSAGTPAQSGSHLADTVLLRYQSSENTEKIERCLTSYQHADEWAGGAWMTTSTGKSALVFVGTKATGNKYWYGWVNPTGTEIPCIEEELLGQFTLCRLANGTPCPESDLQECEGHNDYRGWWSARFDTQIILFDPATIARVAIGKLASWKPQPYATLDIDDQLLLNPGKVEQDMLGTGVQRRYRIGSVAYDRDHDLLYVLELFADGTKPVVHVWRVR